MPDSRDEALIHELRDDLRDCQYERDEALQKAADLAQTVNDRDYEIRQLESRLRDSEYYRYEAERRAERAEENARGW